jgi:hypothetical protein
LQGLLDRKAKLNSRKGKKSVDFQGFAAAGLASGDDSLESKILRHANRDT